jgi:hypothetical protein
MSNSISEQSPVRRHFFDYLVREGFRPCLMADGDIVFHFEGRECFLQWNERDPQLVRIVLVNFRPVGDGDDFQKVVGAAMVVNRRIKVVKMYVADNDTWCVVDLFLPVPEHLVVVFVRSLSVIRLALGMFEEVLQGKLPD